MGWNEEIKKTFKSCGTNVYIGFNTIFTNPSEVVLGDNVRIDPFCLITTQLEVGNYVQICSHAVLGGGSQQKITMGSWSFIGYGSQLFTASEDYSGRYGPVNEFWGSNKIFRGDIKFNDHSGVASQVIVMPGVELPTGTLIGAQSFVYRSPTHEWSVYLGNPLSRHKTRQRDNCLNKLNEPGFIKERS